MKTLALAALLLLPLQDHHGRRASGAEQEDTDASVPPGSRILRIPAADKLTVMAEVHHASDDPTTPLLLLLHDSHGSRGEYREIVPRLTKMGFNTMSIDTRVGGKCKEVKNVTARSAKDMAGLKRSDALLDIEAAVLHARANEAHGKLFLWGSAYTASLALVYAELHPDLVDGVIAFAPGEYFADDGQPPHWVRDAAAALACPVFVASDAGSEADWKPIYEALAPERRDLFVPAKGGRHGSSSLWAEVPESEEYWKALTDFLDRRLPRAAVAPDGGAPATEPPRDG